LVSQAPCACRQHTCRCEAANPRTNTPDPIHLEPLLGELVGHHNRPSRVSSHSSWDGQAQHRTQAAQHASGQARKELHGCGAGLQMEWVVVAGNEPVGKLSKEGCKYARVGAAGGVWWRRRRQGSNTTTTAALAGAAQTHFCHPSVV